MRLIRIIRLIRLIRLIRRRNITHSVTRRTARLLPPYYLPHGGDGQSMTWGFSAGKYRP